MKTPTVSEHQPDQASLRLYVTGFGLSLLFTLDAYLSVTHHLFSKNVLIGGIAGLALAQFLTQLVCFLHLGREFKPRWKLAVFLMMAGIVVILVGGSLWIMNNLNYRMTPQQVDKYLQSQDGL